MQTSGDQRRENAATYPVVIVREGGRSSIPETAMIEPIGRGVLDPPPARGMTRSGNFSRHLRESQLPSFCIRMRAAVLKGEVSISKTSGMPTK